LKSPEIDQVNLRINFSALNVDVNDLSFDLYIGSKSPPYGGVKFGCSFKTRGCCYYYCRASHEH